MRRRIIWHLEVPPQLDKELEDYLADTKSRYKTKSEFIRDSVRKKLREK